MMPEYCPKCHASKNRADWWYSWLSHYAAKAVLRCPCGYEWDRYDYMQIERPEGVK